MSVTESAIGRLPWGRLAAAGRRERVGGARLRAVAAVAAVSALLLLGLAGSWRAPGDTVDEGITLQYPQLILHGEVPFRDFQSSYGVGSYLVPAAAYELFGATITVERAVGVSYRLAVLFAVLALLWPLGLRSAVLGAVTATLAMLPFGTQLVPAAYGWFFALACVLWALWCGRAALLRASRGRSAASGLWALSGGLVGVAVSARPDLGAAALISVAVLMFQARGRARATFAAGLLVGCSPLIWNIAVAGWSAFWIYGVQAREHQLPASGYPFPTGLKLMLVGSATALALVVRAIAERRRHGPSPVASGWLSVALLSALTLPQLFQRADMGHFAFVTTVSFGLLPWAIWPYRPSRAITAALLTLCTAAVAVSALTAAQQTGAIVRNAGRTFSVLDSAPQLQRTLDWLDAKVAPGSRLFVGPADLRWAFYAPTEIYYLTPALKPAGFYLELGPGDDTPQFTRRILTDLERADVLVLDRLQVSSFRSGIWPEARIGSAAPNRLVASRFRMAFRAGEFEVLVRRSPRPR